MEEDNASTVLDDTDQSISIISVEPPPPKRARLQTDQPTTPPKTATATIQTNQPTTEPPTNQQQTQTEKKETKEMTTQTETPEKVNRPVQTVNPYNEAEDNKENKYYAPRIQRNAAYSDNEDENNQQQDLSLRAQGYQEMQMPYDDSTDGNNTSNIVIHHLSPIRSPSPQPPETPQNSPVAGPPTSTPTNRRHTSPPPSLRRRRRPNASRLRLNLFQRDTSDSTRDLFDQL